MALRRSPYRTFGRAHKDLPTINPDACLRGLLSALHEGNRDIAWSACHDLAQWIAAGGDLPRDPRPPPGILGPHPDCTCGSRTDLHNSTCPAYQKENPA
jgi:hypothetical protein